MPFRITTDILFVCLIAALIKVGMGALLTTLIVIAPLYVLIDCCIRHLPDEEYFEAMRLNTYFNMGIGACISGYLFIPEQGITSVIPICLGIILTILAFIAFSLPRTNDYQQQQDPNGGGLQPEPDSRKRR